MAVADDYHQYARECLEWASEAQTDHEQRARGEHDEKLKTISEPVTTIRTEAATRSPSHSRIAHQEGTAP
jgi:hypothetical protein